MTAEADSLGQQVSTVQEMPAPPYRCRICGAQASEAFAAREMMYGTRELFWYFECPDCGCVQIEQLPADLGRYYPADYYSLDTPDRSWRRRVKGPIFRALTTAGAALPAFRQFLQRSHQQLQILLLYQAATQGRRDAPILDVGCGAGVLLEYLVDLGYRNARGIDPFIAADRSYRGRVLVRRADIFTIEGNFDVISFNHSFEHLPDQQAILAQARNLLTERGCVILRLPVVGGEAWETYRESWVQLDPPRHLYLHSLPSLHRLAAQTGFRIAELYFDSTPFQFWGSELYRRGIPLLDPLSPAADGPEQVLTRGEMKKFLARAKTANRSGRGDQVAIRLARVT